MSLERPILSAAAVPAGLDAARAAVAAGDLDEARRLATEIAAVLLVDDPRFSVARLAGLGDYLLDPERFACFLLAEGPAPIALFGQQWIDDPSRRHSRSRLRQAAAAMVSVAAADLQLPDEGHGPAIAEPAHTWGERYRATIRAFRAEDGRAAAALIAAADADHDGHSLYGAALRRIAVDMGLLPAA